MANLSIKRDFPPELLAALKASAALARVTLKVYVIQVLADHVEATGGASIRGDYAKTGEVGHGRSPRRGLFRDADIAGHRQRMALAGNGGHKIPVGIRGQQYIPELMIDAGEITDADQATRFRLRLASTPQNGCCTSEISFADRDEQSNVRLFGDAKPSDPMRTALAQVQILLVEFERATLVSRLRGGREQVRAKAGRCEGQKPYGHYDGEGPVLAQIRAMRDSGMVLPRDCSGARF